MAKDGSSYYLITQMDGSNFYNDKGDVISFSNSEICVLDTALYMQTLLETEAIDDELTISGNAASVLLILPEDIMFYSLGYKSGENEKKKKMQFLVLK